MNFCPPQIDDDQDSAPVTETAPGIVLVAGNGRVRRMNRAARKMLGGEELPLLAGIETNAADGVTLALPGGGVAKLEAWPVTGGGALLILEPPAKASTEPEGGKGLFENAICGTYRDTLDGQPLRANLALARLNGYGSGAEYLEAARSAPAIRYVDPERLLQFHRMMTIDGQVNDFVSEIYRHKSRETLWVSENAWYVAGPDGQRQFIEGTIQDATARVEALARVERQANMDALTGTASRFRFLTELDAVTRSVGQECVLLTIDLDRFKEVNDLFGHGAGDTVLRTVAARLQPLAAKDALLARLGGDEFAMLLTGRHCHMKADVTAGAIVKSLRQPIEIGGHRATVGASVGVAVFPAHAADAEELLTHADLALYQVKAEGRNGFRIFDQQMRARLDRRKTIESELRAAIPGEELELYYQPIVDAASGVTVSFEALMRWNHPRRGFLPPVEFIQVAEDAGLMADLGNWAIRRACCQTVKLPDHLRVAVNVSPNQFRSPGIVSVVKQALAETGLDARRLTLEVTETAILSSEATAARVIDELLRLGVGLALDDFGTGYSSLSYLQRFAFSKVKIDRSFVAGIERIPANLPIIRAVIGLAKDLGLTVVAEGIETAEQAVALQSEGCDYLQGYLYGKPQSFADISANLAVADLRRTLPRTDRPDHLTAAKRTVHKTL